MIRSEPARRQVVHSALRLRLVVESYLPRRRRRRWRLLGESRILQLRVCHWRRELARFGSFVLPQLRGLDVVGLREGKVLDEGFPGLVVDAEGGIDGFLLGSGQGDAVTGVSEGAAGRDAVGDIEAVVAAVEFDLVVGVDEVGLGVDLAAEVLGEASALALLLDHGQQVLQHEELLPRGLELALVRANHLQVRLFVDRVVVREVLVHPHPDGALASDRDHPAADVEQLDAAEALVEAADGLAERVERFGEGEFGEVGPARDRALDGDLHHLRTAAERALAAPGVLHRVDCHQRALLGAPVVVDVTLLLEDAARVQHQRHQLRLPLRVYVPQHPHAALLPHHFPLALHEPQHFAAPRLAPSHKINSNSRLSRTKEASRCR